MLRYRESRGRSRGLMRETGGLIAPWRNNPVRNVPAFTNVRSVSSPRRFESSSERSCESSRQHARRIDRRTNDGNDRGRMDVYVCNSAGPDKDSLPGISRGGYFGNTPIYTFSRAVVPPPGIRETVVSTLYCRLCRETICQICCVIVVINDPYYHSEVLNQTGRERNGNYALLRYALSRGHRCIRKRPAANRLFNR